MPKSKTALERFWHGFLARLQCVVGSHVGGACAGRVQVHHIAQGSGLRSHFSCVPMCEYHHDFFHGQPKTFLKVLKVPGESEYGLLVWLLEDIARAWKKGVFFP